MTLVQLIPLAINLSMGLMVLALGLTARLDDATYLLRRPVLLLQSVLAMNVIMPIFAAAVALTFNLIPAVKIALVALALSPVPPILPSKQTKAGGTASYVIGLLVTAAVLAILFVPLGVDLLSRILSRTETVAASKVAPVVLMSVIAPLAIGLIISRIARDVAALIARPISILATILLVGACVPVLIAAWPQIVAVIGNGTLAVLALFSLFGVAVGHLLGGPEPDNRTVLALATATRHPGVALAIAAATFPQERAVAAVVLWHLVVGAIVSLPYVAWRKRRHASNLSAAKPMV